MKQHTWGSQRSESLGQSTLEYVLLVAAIIVAVIVGVNTFIRPAVKGVVTDSGTAITNASGSLKTKLGL